jgi:hypothetical protein
MCLLYPLDIDRLTAVYVDLAVNVATAFGLEIGMRVLQHKTPLLVVQRVLIEGSPWRGITSATPDPSLRGASRT